MYFLQKSFTFSAAHHLEDYVGKCATDHGHNYEVIVKVATSQLKSNGLAIDFGDIKKIYNEHIDKVYDHKDLNECYPFSILKEHPEQVQTFNPTAENMCRIFYDILKLHIPELYSITIYETPTSFCEYVGAIGEERVQK